MLSPENCRQRSSAIGLLCFGSGGQFFDRSPNRLSLHVCARRFGLEGDAINRDAVCATAPHSDFFQSSHQCRVANKSESRSHRKHRGVLTFDFEPQQRTRQEPRRFFRSAGRRDHGRWRHRNARIFMFRGRDQTIGNDLGYLPGIQQPAADGTFGPTGLSFRRNGLGDLVSRPAGRARKIR